MIPTHDPVFITVALLAGGACCLSLYALVRIKRLSAGANGASLEEKIYTIMKQNTAYAEHLKKIDERLTAIEARMRRVVRNVQTHRFDPFEGSGNSGKQSFALALLDDDGNGAVISSLHAHDKVRVFAKPVQSFTSTHELSDEEKRVIADART